MLPRKTALTAALTAVALAAGMVPAAAYAGPPSPTDKSVRTTKPVKDTTTEDPYATGDGRKN